MRPEVGMRVRLKQESDSDNNGTYSIPEGAEGTITDISNMGYPWVTFDDGSYNPRDNDGQYYWSIPSSWLQFKRGT